MGTGKKKNITSLVEVINSLGVLDLAYLLLHILMFTSYLIQILVVLKIFSEQILTSNWEILSLKTDVRWLFHWRRFTTLFVLLNCKKAQCNCGGLLLFFNKLSLFQNTQPLEENTSISLLAKFHSGKLRREHTLLSYHYICQTRSAPVCVSICWQLADKISV